jgi:ABC-2 type transport system ATP-binding protein
MTPAIRLENVSVRYRLARERIGSLKEYAIRRAQRRMSYDEFEALDDVSIEVLPGETVGIVGRNGAGKSTLLRLIARVMPPTAGRVVVEGRTAPLLELGLGLHGELTGRENVMLQGALLGFSRSKMKKRLERIVEWAELEEFIDAPIRTYSTGMTARLAFSVATDVDPDILLVDEALAVGDERFRMKCRDRMESFRRAGKTVILVSHDLEQVRSNCRRAIWIHEGHAVRDGDSASVTGAYHEWSLQPGDPETVGQNQPEPGPLPAATHPRT